MRSAGDWGTASCLRARHGGRNGPAPNDASKCAEGPPASLDRKSKFCGFGATGNHGRKTSTENGPTARGDPDFQNDEHTNPALLTLIVDNYDSFTYSLFQYLASVNGIPPLVVKNDEFPSWGALRRSLPDVDNIVISPGPGHPENAEDFGISAHALQEASLPTLGICLGHQGLAHIYGGRVIRAPRPLHGRESKIEFLPDYELFRGVEQGTPVLRYHSLVVEKSSLPACLEVTCWTGDEEQLIMGLRHKNLPLHGIQFHPESAGTPTGYRMLQNFRDFSSKWRNSTGRGAVTFEVSNYLRGLHERLMKEACMASAENGYPGEGDDMRTERETSADVWEKGQTERVQGRAEGAAGEARAAATSNEGEASRTGATAAAVGGKGGGERERSGEEAKKDEEEEKTGIDIRGNAVKVGQPLNMKGRASLAEEYGGAEKAKERKATPGAEVDIGEQFEVTGRVGLPQSSRGAPAPLAMTAGIQAARATDTCTEGKRTSTENLFRWVVNIAEVPAPIGEHQGAYSKADRQDTTDEEKDRESIGRNKWIYDQAHIFENLFASENICFWLDSSSADEACVGPHARKQYSGRSCVSYMGSCSGPFAEAVEYYVNDRKAILRCFSSNGNMTSKRVVHDADLFQLLEGRLQRYSSAVDVCDSSQRGCAATGKHVCGRCSSAGSCNNTRSSYYSSSNRANSSNRTNSSNRINSSSYDIDLSNSSRSSGRPEESNETGRNSEVVSGSSGGVADTGTASSMGCSRESVEIRRWKLQKDPSRDESKGATDTRLGDTLLPMSPTSTDEGDGCTRSTATLQREGERPADGDVLPGHLPSFTASRPVGYLGGYVGFFNYEVRHLTEVYTGGGARSAGTAATCRSAAAARAAAAAAAAAATAASKKAEECLEQHRRGGGDEAAAAAGGGGGGGGAADTDKCPSPTSCAENSKRSHTPASRKEVDERDNASILVEEGAAREGGKSHGEGQHGEAEKDMEVKTGAERREKLRGVHVANKGKDEETAERRQQRKMENQRASCEYKGKPDACDAVWIFADRVVAINLEENIAYLIWLTLAPHTADSSESTAGKEDVSSIFDRGRSISFPEQKKKEKRQHRRCGCDSVGMSLSSAVLDKKTYVCTLSPHNTATPTEASTMPTTSTATTPSTTSPHSLSPGDLSVCNSFEVDGEADAGGGNREKPEMSCTTENSQPCSASLRDKCAEHCARTEEQQLAWASQTLQQLLSLCSVLCPTAAAEQTPTREAREEGKEAEDEEEEEEGGGEEEEKKGKDEKEEEEGERHGEIVGEENKGGAGSKGKENKETGTRRENAKASKGQTIADEKEGGGNCFDATATDERSAKCRKDICCKKSEGRAADAAAGECESSNRYASRHDATGVHGNAGEGWGAASKCRDKGNKGQEEGKAEIINEGAPAILREGHLKERGERKKETETAETVKNAATVAAASETPRNAGLQLLGGAASNEQNGRSRTSVRLSSSHSPALSSSTPCFAAGTEQLQQRQEQRDAWLLRPRDTKAQYVQKIEKIFQWIASGDAYEICLTTEFSGQLTFSDADFFSFYCFLRRRNPTPFSVFFRYRPQESRPCSDGVAATTASTPTTAIGTSTAGSTTATTAANTSRTTPATTAASHLSPQGLSDTSQGPAAFSVPAPLAAAGAAAAEAACSAGPDAASAAALTDAPSSFTICCASPELFLLLDEDGWLESRPIKGTRPRGSTPAADDALYQDLLTCEKDAAENIMVVDVVRSDLGRVCVPGSVHVPALRVVESYSRVHQLISTVRGKLRPELTFFDAFASAFPGASMTGAPKKRVMEFLDKLEERKRGVYSGAVGYLSVNGQASLGMVIRTLVFRHYRPHCKKLNSRLQQDAVEASFGAGGAILAGSDPEEEAEEMYLKAESVLALLHDYLNTSNRSRHTNATGSM